MKRANAKALLLSFDSEWIAARTSGPVRKLRQKSEAWKAKGNQNREIDGSRNSKQVNLGSSQRNVEILIVTDMTDSGNVFFSSFFFSFF